MDLLNRAKGFGQNLLDFALDYGQRQYSPEQPNALPQELATDPGVVAAQRAYDRNYRISRGEAIRRGARWYEMDDYGRAGAEKQYGADLMQAAQQAEMVKQMRDRTARETGIRKLLGELELTPQQRDALSVMPADAQQEILARHLFPKTSDAGQATRGSISGFYDRADGVRVAVVQTGDPTNPVQEIELGPVDNRPAELRTLEALRNNPDLLATITGKAGANAYGGVEGKTNAEFRAALPAQLNQTRSSKRRLENLRDRLDEAAQTGRLEQYAIAYDADLQDLNSEMTQLALDNIGIMANNGIKLTPITERELDILMDTSPRISNDPKANKAIIERKLQALERVEAEINRQIAWLRSGRSMLDYGIEGMDEPAPGNAAGSGGRGGARNGSGVQPAPPPGFVPVNGGQP